MKKKNNNNNNNKNYQVTTEWVVQSNKSEKVPFGVELFYSSSWT